MKNTKNKRLIINHNVTSRLFSDNCDGKTSIRILNDRNKVPTTFRPSA